MTIGFGVGVQRLGSFGVSTLAALNAIPAPKAGVLPTGFVYSDPTPANNGVYTWTGSAWQRKRGLGEQIATLTITGGTANAINATPQSGLDLAEVIGAIIIPSAPNTGAVTINGKPVTDSEGVALPADAFAAGKAYFLWNRATEYRAVMNEYGSIGDIVGLQAALDAKVDDSQIDTDTTLAANSDTKIASQKATKSFIDAAVTNKLDADPALTANSDGKIATQKAVRSFVTSALNALKGGVDAAFDTLVEIAAGIATKLNKSGDTMTGQLMISYANPQFKLDNPGQRQWGLDVNGTTLRAIDWSAGAARFQIGADGSLWSSQLGDLNNRINGQALAYANDRVANFQYRHVTLGTIPGTSNNFTYAPGGALIVGGYMTSAGQISTLRYVYPQIYDPVRGWVGFSQAY